MDIAYDIYFLAASCLCTETEPVWNSSYMHVGTQHMVYMYVVSHAFMALAVVRESLSRGKVLVREPGWSRGSTSTAQHTTHHSLYSHIYSLYCTAQHTTHHSLYMYVVSHAFMALAVVRESLSRGKVLVREPGWSRGSTSTVCTTYNTSLIILTHTVLHNIQSVLHYCTTYNTSLIILHIYSLYCTYTVCTHIYNTSGHVLTYTVCTHNTALIIPTVCTV